MRFFHPLAWLGIVILAGCASTTAVSTSMIVQYTLAGGGACVQLGAHPQPPYANVQVSHDTYLAHSEPMLTENPRNPLNLVGGSKFFTDPAHYLFKIGTYASADGGCTWTDGGVLPGFTQEQLTSDVSFAFDTQGNAYVAVLNTGGAESGLSVAASHDGGKTFGAPVSVFDNRTGAVFSDKPWIGVDDTNGPHSGTIYVVWSYDYQNCGTTQAPCTQELGFSRSTDGGQTFSPVRLIEGNAPFCTNPSLGRPASSRKCDGALGATPAILPDGTVAVAFSYINLLAGDPDASGTPQGHHTIADGLVASAIPTKLLVITSADGGTTWTTPVPIAAIQDLPAHFTHETYRNAPLPAFVSDPTTGQLYIAWSDERNGDADIYLATSTDKGQTWSTPVRVNDDPLGNGANQFQPQLAVAPDGVVSVAFFDTRTDPAHLLIDEYLAQSITHGTSFLPNVRVTTNSWNPRVDEPVDGNGQGFIGDYQGLSADNLFVHPFWNDTRTGAQEIFTAAIPSAQP
jgi:hypothetical protein